MRRTVKSVRRRILETFSEDTLKEFNLDYPAYRDCLNHVKKYHYLTDKQISEFMTMVQTLVLQGNPRVSDAATYIGQCISGKRRF